MSSATPTSRGRAISVVVVETEHPPSFDASLEREYDNLARRLAEAGAAEVRRVPYPSVGDLGAADAVVLGGSHAPWAAHDDRALAALEAALLAYRGPVLGICAGMQIQARCAGGRIGRSAAAPRVGFREIEVIDESGLLEGLGRRAAVYHNHTDEVAELPTDFKLLAHSAECRIEAMASAERRWWGTQFHPERFDEEHPGGRSVLERFLGLARA